jgi:hypothetical protein
MGAILFQLEYGYLHHIVPENQRQGKTALRPVPLVAGGAEGVAGVIAGANRSEAG